MASLFLLRYALLILDLISETATRGVLKKKAVFRLITIFTVIAIFDLLLNRRLVLAKTKFLLVSILILKAIDFILKSKRFTSQSSLQAFKRYILDMTFFLCFFGHS